MITGRKIIVAALCLALSVCMLASCAESSENNALLKLEALSKNAPEKYVIVVPASCTEELVSTAKLFADKISAQTGASCNVVFDNGENVFNNRCFLVLLGNTAYSESQGALVGLRRDDYVCRTYENMLVLGGKSDKATVAAVEKYISEVLPICESTSVIAENCDFEYHQSYDVNEIILCGFEMECYTFVCRDGKDSSSYTLLCMLRDIIADKSGYYPDIVYSATPADGKREIIADRDERSQISSIRFDGEDVFISSDTVYGLSFAATEFYNILLNTSEQGKVRADIPYEMTYPYSCAEIGVTTAISQVRIHNDNISSATALAEKLKENLRTVTVTGPLDKDTWILVESCFSNGFDTYSVELSNQTVLPVIIDASAFEFEKQYSCPKDGLTEIKLLLKHKDSGENFDFYFFFGERDGDYTSVVSECFSDAGRMSVAVFMSYGNSRLDVCGVGISTKYNSSVTVEQCKYRCALFFNSNLLCDISGDDKFENGSDGYFNGVDVQKRFCDEFLALIG